MNDESKQLLEETKRHFDVVAEDIKGQVKAVAEQVGGKSEKLNRVDDRLDHIEEDITVVKSDIQFIKTELKQKVDRDEFSALERRVTRPEVKV